MNQDPELLHRSLRTPRAAAVAGIVFSLLLMSSQALIWLSIPANPLAPAAQIVAHSNSVVLALNLLPFAGIAFLWFIAVIRDRLGELEDRFFATVLFGSGLLYVGMMFVATAIAGALVSLLITQPNAVVTSGIYVLGRTEIYRFMSVFGAKMAGVFMMSSSTIFLRTRVVPRWIAFTGYVLAAGLLLSVGVFTWIPAVFPLWVLLVSVVILLEGQRPRVMGTGAS